MRLAFDLFPCQTGSRFRGIGRFTYSLATAMAGLRGAHDMYALASGLYPESVDVLRQNLIGRLPPGHFSAYTHPRRTRFGRNSAAYTEVATALVHRAYQAIAPDAVITTPFEGWGEQGISPLPQRDFPTALQVAVLYDFIPWLFPQQYLSGAPGYKEWYAQRLAALDRFDLLLAISDATRRDAIEILGISPERVVNISGAAGANFRPLPLNEQEKHDTARFGINRPFVLYTGNVDYRKNLDGMLQAYARLPAALRTTHQLVLNQVGDRDLLLRKVHALGLTNEEVVVTGHVTDDELICLYTQCRIFVFPSLYEGFGLPILEAMACGAPVIAADNSSIPEVVGRSDALFDAADSASIAAALEHVLIDHGFRDELARYSIERARMFSWDRTAALAWHAIEAGLAARQTAPVQGRAISAPKARIAMVCPLAEDTAVARHCLALLPLLARDFEIDVFVEQGGEGPVPGLRDGYAIYPHTEFAPRRERYAAVVYQMANHACHAYMLPLMEQWPGVVVLHDIRMDLPLAALARRAGIAHVLETEILYNHGLQALIGYLRGSGLSGLSLNRRVLESSHRLVLTDAGHAQLLREQHDGSWVPPQITLPALDDLASCSAAYAQAIHGAIASDEKHTISRLADALEHVAKPLKLLDEIAHHAAANWSLRKQARILLDVTRLASPDPMTGIPRIVKNLCREICNQPRASAKIELVRMVNGKLWRADHVIASIFDVDVERIPRQEIVVQPGDALLMIGSSCEQYAAFLPTFQAVRQLGGKIVTVVYDLAPLRMPAACPPALAAVFKEWFWFAAEHSDMLLCPSHATVDAVTAYLAEHHFRSAGKLEIAEWPLGSDMAAASEEGPVRAQVRRMAGDRQSPLFLMAGAIEACNGHDFVLDAFELLWRSGADSRLCIAGRQGWQAEAVMQRMRRHPQLNRKLFFIDDCTDAEVELCYRAATALIAAAAQEGCGLALLEAAHHRVPVLASDIPVFRDSVFRDPVFRETGGEGATYFSLASPQHLAQAIRMLADAPAEQRLMMASRMKTITWNESASRLLERIS